MYLIRTHTCYRKGMELLQLDCMETALGCHQMTTCFSSRAPGVLSQTVDEPLQHFCTMYICETLHTGGSPYIPYVHDNLR